MAENLYFSRDTKLYAVFKNKDGVYQAAFELPILDGFGFSQANNTSEITLAEMESSSGVSRRGRRLFNDSLAPAEWNFSTYVRPTVYSSNTHAVEEVLWAQMAGADSYSTPDFISTKFSNNKVTTSDATDLNIVFTQSNRATLQPIDLYFVMQTSTTDPLIYKIEDAAVNEATINFEVDGIATIEWSGFGKNIVDVTADVSVQAAAPGTPADGTVWLDSDNDLKFNIAEGGTFIEVTDDGITSTTNFIRNRITSMKVLPADLTVFPGDGDSSIDGSRYNLTLTGGSITITNNIAYLTPETLGTVNLPIENVTGSRTVTGTLNCYVVYNDTSNGGTSSDLFNDMKATAALAKVVNEFALTIDIGGTENNTPRLKLNMPKCHLEIPAHTIEDVISFETNFHALGTDISSADEINLTYDT